MTCKEQSKLDINKYLEAGVTRTPDQSGNIAESANKLQRSIKCTYKADLHVYILIHIYY